MALTKVTRRREIFNPARRQSVRKRSRPSGRARSTRKNFGEIVTVGLLGNPGQEKKVAKRKARRATSSKHAGRAARTNRGRQAARQRSVQRNFSLAPFRRRRSRHNPPAVMQTLENAAWVAVGGIGSRLAVQFAMGANNTGLAGYGANAAAGGVLYLIAKYGLKKENAANYLLIGATVGILFRLMQDYTPYGQYASFAGLGDYSASTFFVPLVPKNTQDANNGAMLLPGAVTDGINAAKAALLASAQAAANGTPRGKSQKPGMGDVGSGIGGRYATAGRYN